jgi:hypothetical protein
MDDPVPATLRVFLLEHIDSVAQLEALLLLRRAGKPLPVGKVAAALYVPEPAASAELATLQARGLIEAGAEGWRFLPNPMVDLLAETYAKALIPVTNIVHGNPLRLRRFADAFKFRKDN